MGGGSPVVTVRQLSDAGEGGGNKEKKKRSYEFFTFMMFT